MNVSVRVVLKLAKGFNVNYPRFYGHYYLNGRTWGNYPFGPSSADAINKFIRSRLCEHIYTS